MLNRITTHGNCPIPMPTNEVSSQQTKYNRNEKDDMKKAIELLYEFTEKLRELHPNCIDMIENMLQRRY